MHDPMGKVSLAMGATPFSFPMTMTVWRKILRMFQPVAKALLDTRVTFSLLGLK